MKNLSEVAKGLIDLAKLALPFVGVSPRMTEMADSLIKMIDRSREIFDTDDQNTLDGVRASLEAKVNAKVDKEIDALRGDKAD